MKGKGKDEVLSDYLMSETFGLDWPLYDHQRMEDFMLIMSIKNNLIKNKNGGSRLDIKDRSKRR